MPDPFSPKQLEFIRKATAKWNLAHGSVRSGKTVGTLFSFMCDVDKCSDNDIYMTGHTSDTVFRNAVKLILESPQFVMFEPFCTWSPGKHELRYKDKTIKLLGAKDEGAIKNFQGNTWSLGYCDEMTLYPESIIDMIDTRLSKPNSKGYAAMNPAHPDHKIKKWIDKAEHGDLNYYALHFTLDDNPYVDEAYKNRIASSLSGLFYKRNYLGLWCLAEGAIFDFFDRNIYIVDSPPRAAEYWIAAIDYGTNNAFACVIIGVSTGKYTQEGKCLWVEKEYYWDSVKQQRQKTNSEYADDMQKFLEPYGITHLYIDPSAASFKLEMRRRHFPVIDADNDVLNGIQTLTSEMQQGNLFICSECTNLIREIQGYVWDPKSAKTGRDEPLKQNDHAVDATRYAIHTHKVITYAPYATSHNPDEYLRTRFQPTRRTFL